VSAEFIRGGDDGWEPRVEGGRIIESSRRLGVLEEDGVR
jgi:hypothetical protein